jgi:hypothetical protein
MKAFTFACAYMAALLTLLIPAVTASAQEGPIARITLPVTGQTLRGNVTIQGTATSPQLTRYMVSYALEPDLANWIVINGATDPQPNGMLAVWNTHPLPDGKYALRLQVTSSDGSQMETMVRDINLYNTASSTVTGVDQGVTVVVTSSDTVTSSLGIDQNAIGSSLNLSDIPRAFITGAKYALYGFIALAVYLVLKYVLRMLFRKLLHRPIDYGR